MGYLYFELKKILGMYFKTKVKGPMQDEQGLVKEETTWLLVSAESWTEAEAATLAWAEEAYFTGAWDMVVDNVNKSTFENFTGFEGMSHYWEVVLQFTTENDMGKEKVVRERIILNVDTAQDVIDCVEEVTKDHIITSEIVGMTKTKISEYIDWEMFSQEAEEVKEGTPEDFDTEEDYR